MRNHPVKLLLYYFAAAGLAVHLLLLVIVAKDQTVLPLIQEKMFSFVFGNRAKAAVALPSPELIRADIAKVFTPWQPDASRYPARQGIWLNNQPVDNLVQAAALLEHGDTLHIGSGTYDSAFKITKNDITIIGYGHVVFEKGNVNGKGFILAAGDNLTVQNIECRYISVPSQNGACIRLEGSGLTLDNVYFHSSEEGILETANKPGNIYISNSRFELLGKAGQAHAMYLNSANLYITKSMVLASKDQGHGIKSRGAITVIENSILAGFNAQDSRLIDIPNGGQLTIKNTVLQQGAYSANHQAIGYGLEGMKYSDNAVNVHDNVFILERQGSNLLYKAAQDSPQPEINNNMIIGADSTDKANYHFKNREKAGLAPYPWLPALLCESGQKC
mgnify:CR=1 FL=1